MNMAVSPVRLTSKWLITTSLQIRHHTRDETETKNYVHQCKWAVPRHCKGEPLSAEQPHFRPSVACVGLSRQAHLMCTY